MFLKVDKWKVLAIIFGLAIVAFISLLQAFPTLVSLNKRESS